MRRALWALTMLTCLPFGLGDAQAQWVEEHFAAFASGIVPLHGVRDVSCGAVLTTAP